MIQIYIGREKEMEKEARKDEERRMDDPSVVNSVAVCYRFIIALWCVAVCCAIVL
jgi:hypothetical protein